MLLSTKFWVSNTSNNFKSFRQQTDPGVCWSLRSYMDGAMAKVSPDRLEKPGTPHQGTKYRRQKSGIDTHHMGKWQKHKKTSHTREPRVMSPLMESDCTCNSMRIWIIRALNSYVFLWPPHSTDITTLIIKVKKAKIRNWYNQEPHRTRDTI